MGFGYLFVSDHIVLPKRIDAAYPYTPGGEFPAVDDFLEQLTLLAFLTGQTRTARLLTSVMVVPYRAAVHTAKVLATIDVLSGGRLTLGCGVGWMREEFEALGTPPFEKRGAVTDEYLRAFKELWTEDTPAFDGEYVHFADLAFEPKPVQKPHPPIWIGGESPPALRRAATLGDGWYPIGASARYPIETAVQMRGYLTHLWRYAEDAGRKPSDIDIAFHAAAYDDREAQTLPDGSRRPFTGTPGQIADDIRGFEDVGVRHIFFYLHRDTLKDTLDQMERFMTEVTPLAV